ncbi:Spp1 protein [Martiniozyma asiatica (nom. inval.)]|nr:Spp1 protein [Martiniozyma asiatica]
MNSLQRQFDTYRATSKFSSDGKELYCVCRQPDTGSLMVACDGCDDWFHFHCMKISPLWGKLVKSYYCPFCDQLMGKGQTLWKRKCRLPQCYEPCNEGAYCSEPHGEQFWKMLLSRYTSAIGPEGEFDSKEKISKVEIEQLVNSLKDCNELQKLGTSIPESEQVEMTNSEIDLNDVQIASFESKQAQLEIKLNFLVKLKDLVASINAALNQTNPLPDEAPKKKKGKSKTSRVDICGYSSHLSNWDSFAASDAYHSFIESNTDLSKIVIDYNELKNNDFIDQSSTSLKDLCISDKRRCLHNGWYMLEKDDIEDSIQVLSTKISHLKAKNEKIRQKLTLRNWEDI